MSKDLKVLRGIALYPRLNEPDTKFNANGEYRVRLRITPEQAETLTGWLDEATEAGIDIALEAASKKKGGSKLTREKVKIADRGVQPEYDDE